MQSRNLQLLPRLGHDRLYAVEDEPTGRTAAGSVHGHGPPSLWTWTGEFDVDDVVDLQRIWQLKLQTDPCCVVINMSEVTFLDCSILSFLIKASRHVPGLVVRSPSLPVRRLMKLAQLTALLEPREPSPLLPPAA